MLIVTRPVTVFSDISLQPFQEKILNPFVGNLGRQSYTIYRLRRKRTLIFWLNWPVKMAPRASKDCQSLVRSSLNCAYLTHDILRTIPKLETFQPSLKLWSTLASKLRRLEGSDGRMVGLAESITRKFFKRFEPFPATWSSNSDVHSWIDALEASIESEDRQQVVAIIEHIVEETGRKPDKAYVANYYLVPSVSAIKRMLRPMGLPPSDRIFAPYWAIVIQVITYELLFGDQFTNPRKGVKALTKAIQFSRDPGPLRDLSVLPS
jgi:hypothetical protein